MISHISATAISNAISVTSAPCLNPVKSLEVPVSKPCPGRKAVKTCREIRQLRMFKAILVLMVVFLVCRLPTWIFLLYKLHNSATSNLMWMLHYCFGLLSLVNCVLNPFLYTFLTETILWSFQLADALRRVIKCEICRSEKEQRLFK